jgi:anti-sigma B factor antagonist
MEISLSTSGNINIISLKGNLLGEVDGMPMINSYTESKNNGVSKMIYDLSELKFINSTGLGSLMTLLNKSKSDAVDLYFTNIPNQLDKLLTMTKLKGIFNHVDTIENAQKLMA